MRPRRIAGRGGSLRSAGPMRVATSGPRSRATIARRRPRGAGALGDQRQGVNAARRGGRRRQGQRRREGRAKDRAAPSAKRLGVAARDEQTDLAVCTSQRSKPAMREAITGVTARTPRSAPCRRSQTTATGRRARARAERTTLSSVAPAAQVNLRNRARGEPGDLLLGAPTIVRVAGTWCAGLEGAQADGGLSSTAGRRRR